MPRRYRYVILAGVGCLGLVVLGWLRYDPVFYGAQDPYPDAEYQPARKATFPPAPGEHEPRAKTYDPHCQAPGNRDDSDLCAQWSAVEAVNESNRVAQLALKSGWLDFLALILTLIFTAWAAWAAQRAASAANDALAHEIEGAGAEAARFSDQLAEMKRTADAMASTVKVANAANIIARDTVAATRDVGIAQVRAYVSVTKIEAFFSSAQWAADTETAERKGPIHHTFNVDLSIGNFGRTPARRVSTSILLERIGGSAKDALLELITSVERSIDLSPNDKESPVFNTNHMVPEDEGKLFIAGRISYRLSGEVTYDPVVGDPERKTPFAYSFTFDDAEGGGVKVSTDRGVGPAT